MVAKFRNVSYKSLRNNLTSTFRFFWLGNTRERYISYLEEAGDRNGFLELLILLWYILVILKTPFIDIESRRQFFRFLTYVGKLPRNNVIDPPRGNVLKYCSDFKTKVCNKVDFSGFSTTAGRFGTGFFFPSAFRIGRRSWDLEFIVLSENFVAEHFTDNSEHFGSFLY